MSIAVLRTFVEKRKEEHAAMLSRKERSESKASKGKSQAPAAENTSTQEEKANGGSEMSPNRSPEEKEINTEECPKASSGRRVHELKAPTVLEVR